MKAFRNLTLLAIAIILPSTSICGRLGYRTPELRRLASALQIQEDSLR